MKLSPNQLSVTKIQEINENFEKLVNQVKEIPEPFGLQDFMDTIENIKNSIDGFANASKQSGFVEGCLAAANDFIRTSVNLMQEYAKAPK